MAVTMDTASYGTPTNTGGANYTWDHTAGALTNGYVTVAVFINNDTLHVESMTYDGVSMAILGTVITVGGATMFEVWGLKNPAGSGTKTIAFTQHSAEINRIGVVTWNGVDQASPTSNITSNTGSDAAPTVTVTSAVGDIAVATTHAYGATFTPAQTLDYSTTGDGARYLAGQHMNGAASPVALAWSIDGPTAWGVHGFSLKAYVEVPGLMWL